MPATFTPAPTSPTLPEDRQERQRRWAGQFRLYIGVDAAKLFHAIVARGPEGAVLERAKVDVGRATFAAWWAELRATFPGITPAQMLVGIEFAGHHGSTLAAWLRAQGCTVVSVLAMSTKKTREASFNSRLKSDLRDARQIATLVRDGTFVRFPALRPDVAACKQLAMHRHRLGVERARLRTRAQGILDLAWPEFMAHFSGLDHVTPRALLQRWPTPAAFAAASLRTVTTLLKTTSRGQCKTATIQSLRASAATSLGLTDATAERSRELLDLLARWALLDEQVAAVEAQITNAVAACPEAALLTSVPEISAPCAGMLVGELGHPSSFDSPRQWLKLAGLNGVTAESGLSAGVLRLSKRGRPMLRRQLFLLAGRWCQSRGLYRSEYLRLKAAGRSGTESCVILARRLVPILFAVLRDRRPFDVAVFRQHRHPVPAT
jgi:transposase